MKLDEEVKMISAEAPIIFAKASEIFIQEVTIRAWLHTEENKRRTLQVRSNKNKKHSTFYKDTLIAFNRILFIYILLIQRNDVALAISKYDQFDFLIDIVPREEIKPSKKVKKKKKLS
jgi:nuclear transcription factor Y, gamma